MLTDFADMDKLVSIKGLIIRTTPIIPDMKDGQLLKSLLNFYLTNSTKRSFVVPSVIIVYR